MKIALIAMSGVRAYNEELTALGMTMPGFMERGEVIASLPSLSLLTLAGMTPECFDVEYHQVPTSGSWNGCQTATWPPSPRSPPR